MTSTAGQKPLDLGSKFVSAERALAAIRAGNANPKPDGIFGKDTGFAHPH
jgi:hypothetical protein